MEREAKRKIGDNEYKLEINLAIDLLFGVPLTKKLTNTTADDRVAVENWREDTLPNIRTGLLELFNGHVHLPYYKVFNYIAEFRGTKPRATVNASKLITND